ncbi:conserved hypothetical protein [Shewanella violacea DSS12]|uniref:DUF3880 domain-containing protein n=1 Tax=Shewanella violacea (strain JCM 10179 / CIP 106290 / LMG 19151 / DSS12) TaxID=637905 RepID=D4ZFZ3_SHEVD|nr:conserved hypothetical protein [Shewanella violacea DSS12]
MNPKTEELKLQPEEVQQQLKYLQQQLDIAKSKQMADQISMTELKRNNLKNRISLGEKQLEQTKLDQQLLDGKYQIVKVKNHLSYKLGHSLINSTKSWRNLFSLPRDLLRIRAEAKRKRGILEEKTLQNKILLVSPPEQEKDLLNLKRELQYLPVLSDASKLKGLKIACVMDTFTYECYAPEAVLLQLTPDNWQAELEAFTPDMLFIESAWRGKDELWGNKVGHTSQELVNIVQWCKENRVTTMFWNKEDPIHFENFLNTAKLFDHIFTTDIDCISRYKKALGHNQVYFLPFAAQPKLHNPVEKYQRQDKFCFAGAYYVKYPERTKDLNNFVFTLPEYRDIEIYDRNFGKNDPNYMFPEEYQPFIVGTLSYDQIDKAYKGYNYAINLNSIKQSQSMFARRVFELLASNTVTVSNFSHGMRLMFGELVFTSDSGEEIVRRLTKLTGDELKLKQFRLLALRKVMSEHTYQDRLNYIHSKLANTKMLAVHPKVQVLSYAKTPEALEYIYQSFQCQNYDHKFLTVVISGFESVPDWLQDQNDVHLLTPIEADSIALDKWAEDSWVSVMVPEDFYGEEYLTDLVLAIRYTDHKVIGKKAYYRWQENLVKSYPKAEYEQVSGLTLRQSLMAASMLPVMSLRQWLPSLYTWKADGPHFSIDSFSYCMNGMGHCEALPEFQSPAGINTGMNLAELQVKAELMAPAALDISKLKTIKPAELSACFKPGRDSQCVSALANGKLQIASQLPDGKHEYWYSSKDFSAAELNAKGGKLVLHLETSPGLNLQMVMLFLDINKQRLSHTIFSANKNSEIIIPQDAVFLRPALRVYAGGNSEISNFYLEEKPDTLIDQLGTNEFLILTNHYPSYDNLYRNGFVHSRVRAYKELDVQCDIYKLNLGTATKYDEFEGIRVTEGGQEQLLDLLAKGSYKKVLVHFLDSHMWDILKNFNNIEVLVWVHGAEVQPFHRREYNYINASTDVIRKAKKDSEERLEFWRELLKIVPSNLHLIFVSKYFAEEVMEDLELRLPDGKYSIIHNPIDTDIFNYVEKDPQQRLKILSIRPYASAKYANDLSVKAILELSKESFFDELEFRIIGDGPLFDEILKPLREFKNVIIERKFLKQSEIAELHKDYGIFLTPTRMDAQGVSRDEAMASGLVPITNAVAAIPEFVDEECGILAEDNDYIKMAEGLTSLYKDKNLFSRMSQNCTKRVGYQLSHKKIIDHELSLLR